MWVVLYLWILSQSNRNWRLWNTTCWKYEWCVEGITLITVYWHSLLNTQITGRVCSSEDLFTLLQCTINVYGCHFVYFMSASLVFSTGAGNNQAQRWMMPVRKSQIMCTLFMVSLSLHVERTEKQLVSLVYIQPVLFVFHWSAMCSFQSK